MNAPQRFSSEDLVARAAGILPPAEAEAIDAAMRSDSQLRQRFEEVAAHLLLYEGVAEAPPPPPFEAIAKRLDEAPAIDQRLRTRLYRLAAASVAAAAVIAVVLWSSAPGKPLAEQPVRVAIEAGAKIGVFRENQVTGIRTIGGDYSEPPRRDAVALADARAWDVVVADERGTLRVGDRARIAIDEDTGLRLVSDDEVRLEGGRADFEVSHLPPSPDGRVPSGAPAIAFRVRTYHVNVEVRGTRFAVEVYDPQWPTPINRGQNQIVLVNVQDGVVTANDVRIGAGEQRLFVGREAVAIESRSIAVSLEAPSAPDSQPRAGGPVDVRMVFSNSTDAPAAVPVRDGVASPIFIEVTRTQGIGGGNISIPVRITPNMLTDADRAPKIIPPHGRVALTVRFERSFPVAGTYRLRVLFQPANVVSSPGSGDLVLDVR